MAARTTVADLRTASDGFEAVLTQVGEAWDAPSPCEGWTAGDVVDHVTGNLAHLAGAFGAQVEEGAGRVERYRAAAAAALAAAQDEAALERPTRGPMGGELPGFVLAGILTTDVLVHTWDLARAVGVDVVLDEELSRRSYEGALPMDAALRTSGMFGPRVPVPEDAGHQDQLIGFFGRTP